MNDEFLGIEESEIKKKDDRIIIAFPNLKSLIFGNLIVWEEWIGIEGEEEEEEDCNIIIMPHLQELSINTCLKLKLLSSFFHTTALQNLNITLCPILKKCCQRETREDWSKIFHIPNILIDNNIAQINSWEFNPEVTSFAFSSPLDSSFYFAKI